MYRLQLEIYIQTKCIRKNNTTLTNANIERNVIFKYYKIKTTLIQFIIVFITKNIYLQIGATIAFCI